MVTKDFIFCTEFPRENSVEELKHNSYDQSCLTGNFDRCTC